MAKSVFQVIASGHLREPRPNRVLWYLRSELRDLKMDFPDVAGAIAQDYFKN